MRTINHPRTVAVGLLLGVMPATTLACSVCSCTLNADWASQGTTVGPGLRLDLRHDDFTQDQLRTGTGKTPTAEVALPNADEVQHETHNRVTTLGVDWSPSYRWGYSLQLPWVDRAHDTWDAGETTLSASHTRSIGDARVLARWQGFAPETHAGLQFGLKLPTGDTSADFDSGPTAGEALDRGLQPGTGTTDLLLGAYRYGALGEDAAWFAQAQLQVALDDHDEFRPGNALTGTLGARWLATGRVTPQLQLNYRVEGPESGAQSDRDNSGARQLFASPGINVQVNKRLDAFLFAQWPLWQDVNGTQLEPRRLLSAGMHYRL